MFDFEYTLPLTLTACGTLIDPTISDIIEEHSQMLTVMEEYENGNNR